MAFPKAKPDRRPLMDVADVRVHLKLKNNKAVYHLIEKCGLPTRRIGGRIRVDFAELEQWTKRDQPVPRPMIVFAKGA